MLRNKMFLGLALLAVGLVLLGGCASSSSSQENVIGTWTYKGNAPKSANPASANYTLTGGSAASTQQFLADGTYIDPTGAKGTWKRIDSKTVSMAGVKVIMTIDGNDMYEEIGNQDIHWVKK
jgi:hypothetical protein